MTEPVRPPAGHETGTTARRATPETGARRRRVPSLKITAAAAIAGFLVVFELLAYQLRSGHDPAIGSGPLTAQVRSGSATGTQQAPGSSGAVVTRASGATTSAAPGTQAAAAGAQPSRPSSRSITTRSSGGQPGIRSVSGDDGYEHEGRL
jgi:hypothetical protein